jgi:hypothetical protein
MTMPVLECRRGALREYVRGAEEYFSVSQVRKVAHDPFVGVPEGVLKEARSRGVLLHRRFWRVLAAHAGLVDPPPVIPWLEGYCASMDAWVASRLVPGLDGVQAIEETLVNRDLGYAGTKDARVVVRGRRAEQARVAVIDMKTGGATITDKMQLFAYEEMEEQRPDLLLDVYVQADGRPAIEIPALKKERPGQWCWFLSALGVLKARANYGVR